MKKVLFICRYHAGRSPMAEAFLKHYGKGRFEVASAGYEAGEIHPMVIAAMAEKGIDISSYPNRRVADFLVDSTFFGVVISLCDRNLEEDCPVYPGYAQRFNSDLTPVDHAQGSEEEQMERVRALRDLIEERVKAFVASEESES